MKNSWNPATQRRYDPNTDNLRAPRDEAERQRLIGIARRYVQKLWATNLYRKEIHERMMAEGHATQPPVGG